MNVYDRISGIKCGRSALVLWEELKRLVGTGNETKVSRYDLARRFRVSTRTLKNWSRALERVGALKFKFSGVFVINPEAYYNGSDIETAKIKFADFKGD